VSAVADAQLVLTLGFAGPMPRCVDRPARLVAQPSTALMNNLQEARLEAAQARGQDLFHLQPRFNGTVRLWQTSAMSAVCEAGRVAARQALPEIRGRLASRAQSEAANESLGLGVGRGPTLVPHAALHFEH
jgi:NTE family protein